MIKWKQKDCFKTFSNLSHFTAPYPSDSSEYHPKSHETNCKPQWMWSCSLCSVHTTILLHYLLEANMHKDSYISTLTCRIIKIEFRFKFRNELFQMSNRCRKDTFIEEILHADYIFWFVEEYEECLKNILCFKQIISLIYTCKFNRTSCSSPF